MGTCSATTTGNAVVNTFPALNFTANSPCDGFPVNFTNTTTNPAAISTWHWDFGDGDTSNLQSPVYTYTAPPGFSASDCYPVVLTATATTGCSGTYSTTVNIHNNPFAYFNAFEACLGVASEFVDSSFIQNPPCLNDNITTWQWSFGDGSTITYNIGTLPDTVKHIYALCGPYNITLTVTTNNNCTNVNTLTGDTVFCIPSVVASSDFSVCQEWQLQRKHLQLPVLTEELLLRYGGSSRIIRELRTLIYLLLQYIILMWFPLIMLLHKT